ncbi:DUF169 domain-containing protein [Thermoanaerobacter kivui]|uniref:DUF169 domain-containing protein n=1 Tax=Thermoanaerobacter kivui TaxID=2325 RepID=UPI0037351F8D
MKEILGLEREPVGVKFLKEKEKQNLKDNYDDVTKTRYCKALMRVGNGEKVMVTSENISCPASAAAFGLKPSNNWCKIRGKSYVDRTKESRRSLFK